MTSFFVLYCYEQVLVDTLDSQPEVTRHLKNTVPLFNTNLNYFFDFFESQSPITLLSFMTQEAHQDPKPVLQNLTEICGGLV
jgi:hypothetical protein